MLYFYLPPQHRQCPSAALVPLASFTGWRPLLICDGTLTFAPSMTELTHSHFIFVPAGNGADFNRAVLPELRELRELQGSKSSAGNDPEWLHDYWISRMLRFLWKQVLLLRLWWCARFKEWSNFYQGSSLDLLFGGTDVFKCLSQDKLFICLIQLKHPCIHVTLDSCTTWTAPALSRMVFT